MQEASGSYPPRKVWSGADFDRASKFGMFDGARLELVDGDLLQRPQISPGHAQGICLAQNALFAIFPPRTHTLSIQCPMRLGESRPFPDVALVLGTAREINEHPTTALLVIEVSDAVLPYYRKQKASLYAAHSLADYWIINLNGRCVEVHRKPIGRDTGDPRYGEVRVYSASETLSPLAAPDALIRVADLLP